MIPGRPADSGAPGALRHTQPVRRTRMIRASHMLLGRFAIREDRLERAQSSAESQDKRFEPCPAPHICRLL